jgi:hypothetical protein
MDRNDKVDQTRAQQVPPLRFAPVGMTNLNCAEVLGRDDKANANTAD